MKDELPPGLPALQKRLLLVIEAGDAKGESDPYPNKMPTEHGRILITDINQPPGGKLAFETHQIHELSNEDWFGKIFIPHFASGQEVFTVHPDRVIRRKLMQLATSMQAYANERADGTYAQRAGNIRHCIGSAHRIKDLAQAFHTPAILTFSERVSFGPINVKRLLEVDQPINDEEHLKMMIQLCQSL